MVVLPLYSAAEFEGLGISNHPCPTFPSSVHERSPSQTQNTSHLHNTPLFPHPDLHHASPKVGDNPPKSLPQCTYHRAGVVAGRRLGREPTDTISSTSPSSLCACIVPTVPLLPPLARWTDSGWTDGWTDRAAGRVESCELDKPSSRAAPPALQWRWLAAWERDLGSALGGRLVPNPEVYSLGRGVIRNSCAARWFILMF